MSHVVTIAAKIRDPVALAAACVRLGLSQPTQGTAQLFSGSATGLIVQFPGWHYPAVIEPATGEVRYDNFAGNWGDQKELDKLLQAYAVEKSRIECRRSGHTMTEQTLADGSIKLTIQVGRHRPRAWPERRWLVRDFLRGTCPQTSLHRRRRAARLVGWILQDQLPPL